MPNKTQNFLAEIIKLKKADSVQKTIHVKGSEKQNFIKSESKFLNALLNKKANLKLIAEIKLASPTNSVLGSRMELIERAKMYEEAGADAISLITESHFFKGDISFISKVKKSVSLPVLQKDFVIASHQIYEAQKAGADALLLIARLLDSKQLKEFVKLCFLLAIEPVVEVNDEEDLEKAVATDTNIIAVNARDLETLTIDVVGACMLLEKIPEKFITLGFSGINSNKEALLYKESGANGILVGTSLMKAKNIKDFIQRLQL